MLEATEKQAQISFAASELLPLVTTILQVRGIIGQALPLSSRGR